MEIKYNSELSQNIQEIVGLPDEVVIQSTEPTDGELWIDPTDTLTSLGTEVVNTLSGDQTNLAPSVNAVNDGLDLKLDKTSIKTSETTSASDTYSCTYINGIVESGSSGGVNYVKYNDGTMIQYFTQSISVSSNRSAGGLTYYSGSANVTLPIAFTDTYYVCTSNVQIANMNYFAQSYVAQVSTTEVQVSFASTGSSETRNIQIMLIGKWK